MRLFVAAVMLLACCALAQAQQCGPATTMTSPLTFTGLDILGGGAVETSGNLHVKCTGLIGLMQVCPSFDAGTGGANGSIARRMVRVGGTETIDFQLYQDVARTIPWGSLTTPSLGTTPAIGVLLVLGLGGEADRGVYAKLLANQQTVPPGTYRTTINTSLKFGAVSVLTGCDSPLLTSTQAGPSFVVEVTVPKSCLLSVQTNVNFGSVSLLNANIDSEGVLSVRCTNTTPYSVALGAGGGSGATVANRKMTGPGGAMITYRLFRDIGRTQNWGQTGATDTLDGNGTGLEALRSVYGRVIPQTTPGIGTYNDTVLVTLTY